jgi:hypothetical protein
MTPRLALDAARGLLKRGWSPVPIPFRKKGPTLQGWGKLEVTEKNIAKYFNGERLNVGVILGSRSKGLRDVDLDCAEALQLAHYFLPATAAVFGRNGKPNSHHLYYADLSDEKGAIKYELSKDLGGGTLVELRIGGGVA